MTFFAGKKRSVDAIFIRKGFASMTYSTGINFWDEKKNKIYQPEEVHEKTPNKDTLR
jgi:hypothetical protein